MAVDPLIVVGMAILICVIFVINVYILVYYSHPEDKNESYLAKALVVLGLQLSAMSVLMLPIGDDLFLCLLPIFVFVSHKI
jgi:LMBR1-like membrane protein